MNSGLIEALEACRAAEREQALFYRALSARAEALDDAALSERLHGLHADEQHHVSRLTARLLELGAHPVELAPAHTPAPPLEGWEAAARERERAESRRYHALLQRELDPHTAALVREILEVERHHEAELGGKWTLA